MALRITGVPDELVPQVEAALSPVLGSRPDLTLNVSHTADGWHVVVACEEHPSILPPSVYDDLGETASLLLNRKLSKR